MKEDEINVQNPEGLTTRKQEETEIKDNAKTKSNLKREIGEVDKELNKYRKIEKEQRESAYAKEQAEKDDPGGQERKRY